MTKKPQRLFLTIILLTMLLSFSTCAILIPNAKAFQNVTNSTASTPILPSSNATSVTPISPPSIGGSTHIIQVNATTIATVPVLPSANITSSTHPYLTPHLIKQANGTITAQEISPAQQTDGTWLTDYWATQSGGQLPSYLAASFNAAPNTFDNLGSGWVDYEPLNVCYGSSSSDWIWYQLVVTFNGGGVAPFFGLCINPSWQPNDYYTYGVYIPGGYVVGDTYLAQFVPFVYNGVNEVMFWIENVNAQQTWTTYSYDDLTPPGTTLIYQFQAYSPASCVETWNMGTGYTVTNCPFMEADITSVATYYSSGSAPYGIQTTVTSGDGNYYWSMLSQNSFDVSSITYYGTYGYGSVSNPNNLVGNRDYYYANIGGPNPGDGGYICGQMSGVAGGNIWICGYSTSGYYSNLYVYVSMDDNTWYQIGNYITISSPGPYWISVGYYADFKYIAVAGYDTYDSINLHLDAVTVGP